MIRATALGAALIAIAVDLAGAWLAWRHGLRRLPLSWAAMVSAIALAPCALAFLALMVAQGRRRGTWGVGWRRSALHLPIAVPRGYVGAAVLGGIAALAAMGERFGLYVFLAGIVLIALALSQALPGRR